MVLKGNSDSSKCVICRNGYNLSASTVKANKRSFTNVFSTWKNECATALCHVLFDKHIDYFVNYFENTHYCSGCEQLVRDVSFTWKQIRLFENRLNELSRNMSQILDINYQLIHDKSEPLVVEERLSNLINTADPLKTSDYSYDEMVEVLKSAVSSGLNPYLKETNINSNSSLSNVLKTYQSSPPSFGEDSIPTTLFEGINKIKEECLDINDVDVEIDEQANYSPCYNENEDQQQIQPENFDSSTDEDLKPIGIESKVVNTLRHKKPKQNESSPHCIPGETKSSSPNGVISIYAYNCKFCGKGYIKESELQTHYATSHQGPNPFTCAFCPSVFTGAWNLSKHRKTAHPDPIEREGKLKCKSCDKYFANKQSLSVHSKRSHRDPNSLLKCHYCSAVFRQPSSLNNHLLFHKNKSQFVCEICGKACTSAHTLRNHATTHGKDVKDKISLEEKDTAQNKNYEHECKFCCKGYITEEELNSHYAESHQGPNPFTCAFCPVVYSNSVDLSQHQKSAHPETTNALAGKLKCKSCDRYFSNKRSLRVHARNHLDSSLLLKCPLCPTSFTRNYLLKLHVDTHRNERKHICETCGKAYNREDALRKHLKLHDESNRKYQCSICDKKFFQKSYCKDHERTHSKMKEFICQICGKHFNRDWNLKEHLKIHAGVPPRSRTYKQKQKKQDFQLKDAAII